MRCATLLFVCSTLLAICAFGAEAKPRPPADAAPALELLPNGTVPTSESSGRIVCFGDSWAAFACDSLASAVALAGKKNKVTNRGVPGSTATMWASNTNAMLAQIVAEGIPDYIWLSIGGNDILDGNAQHKCNGSAEGQSYCNLLIFNAMTTMLDAIYKELPFVQIVIFGYDFTNFVYNAECQALALYEFGTQYGNQYDINTIFLGYAEDVLVSLQADYNPLLFQYIPMWGTLQEAGGSQYTPPPYPNTMYPSPEYLMDDGCIHASKEGWSILMTQLYKLYFASRI